MTQAVIMAGGAGTRLWPLSRANRPKQLLRLLGGRSLLRQSFERLTALLAPENVYVITGARYLPLVAEELPEVPGENLIGEPVGRDTANAVGLAAAILHRRDPDGVMGVFTADHVITPLDHFTEAVDLGFKTAEANPGALITFGIKVRHAETAFGYVRRGERVSESVYQVEEFTEKPDAETARRYAASGDYYWNSGMFAWRTSAILEQLRIHLPASHRGLTEIAEVWDSPAGEARLEAIFATLEKISIDFAVMERARRVLVVPMDCYWADLGSWTQLEAVTEADGDGNVITAKRAISLGARGNTLVTEDEGHLIAAIGVHDVIIVHSPDATLVCRKDEAQSLKDLVARVKEEYGEEYL